MIGQETKIDVTKEPREATPIEVAIWNRFLADYENLKKTARRLHSTLVVANEFQIWLDRHNIPITCIEAPDKLFVSSWGERFNIIGRLIAGCDTRKYWAFFEKGDVVILAPPAVPQEQYQADIYPGAISPEMGLGIAPVVAVALIAGAVLIAGAITTVAVLDYQGKKKDHEFRMKVLNTNIEVLKQPKPVQDAWTRMKQASADIIERANKEHESGWFDGLFKGGVGGLIGGIAVVIGLLVAYQISKK